MVLLGMGIYGTSSGTSSDDLLPNMNDLRSGSRNDMSDKGESFLKEDSMAATARILWEVMNPNHTDTFLEVRPPTYVTFLGPNSSNTNRKQPKPDQRITTKYSTQSSSHSGTDQSRGPLSSPPPTDGSPPTRTSALNLFIQIVRSSTTIFIVAVVSFLLSTILACLGVTSFLQLCAAAVQQYKISLEEATRRSNGGKEGQVSPVLIWKAWIWMWRNGTRANRSVTFRSESESVPSSHPWIAGVGRILTLRGSPSTGISVADVLATESGKVYWADSNSNIRSWDVHSGVLDEIDLAAGVSTSERLTSSRATMGAPLVLSSVDGPSAYGSTQWSSFVAVGSGAGLLFSSEGGNLTPAKNSKHVMARLLPPITDVIASENQQTFLDYQSCHIIAGLGICSVFDRLVPCGAELWQIRSPMPTTHTNSATTTPYFEGANDNEFPFSAVESQPTPHVGETSWNVSYLGVLDVRNIPVESESLEDEKFTLVDTKTTDFLVTSLAVTRKGWILMGLGDGRMILWSPTSSTSDLASTQPNGIAPYTIILVQKCHSSAIASIAVCDVDTAAGDTAFSFVSTGDDTGVLSLHILKASMRSSMSSMQELWSSHSGRRRSFNRKAGLTKIERCDRSGQYQVTDTNRHSLDSTASSISTSSVLTRHEGRITKIILAREDGNPPDNRRKQSQKLWRPYGESLKEAVSSTTSSVMMVTAAEDEMVHVWQFQIVLDKSSSTTSAKSNQSSDFCELTAWNYIGSMNQNGCADCDLYDGLLIGVRRAEVDLNSSDSLRPRSSESLPSSKRSSLDVRYMTSSDDRGATDATESSNWRGLGLTWFSMRRRSTVGDWASQTAELRDWRWECWIVDLRNLLQRRRDEILMQRRQQALSQSMPKMTGLSYGSPAISGDSGDDTCSDRMRILVPDRTFVLGADGLRGYGRRLGLSNMRSRDEEWASILKQMDERRCFEMAPLDVGAEENGSGASRDKLDVQSDNGSEIDEVLPDCVLGVKKVKAVGWGIVCDFGEFVKVIAFNEDTWLSA
ncbi:hypothetical protein BJ742DRAFT_433755 [Cladochytrium replicatum]|nr:hypothetical protein BJ742DRAFT_433755 [Cladochytrium replicatum]